MSMPYFDFLLKIAGRQGTSSLGDGVVHSIIFMERQDDLSKTDLFLPTKYYRKQNSVNTTCAGENYDKI